MSGKKPTGATKQHDINEIRRMAIHAANEAPSAWERGSIFAQLYVGDSMREAGSSFDALAKAATQIGIELGGLPSAVEGIGAEIAAQPQQETV